MKYDIWWQQLQWFSWEPTFQISCSLNSTKTNRGHAFWDDYVSWYVVIVSAICWFRLKILSMVKGLGAQPPRKLRLCSERVWKHLRRKISNTELSREVFPSTEKQRKPLGQRNTGWVWVIGFRIRALCRWPTRPRPRTGTCVFPGSRAEQSFTNTLVHYRKISMQKLAILVYKSSSL